MTGSYRNFTVAIYARAYEVTQMADLDWLRTRFDVMQRWIKVDKVYLETHRDGVMPDEAGLLQAKAFFADRGVRTSGGITYTINERNRFETFCYSRPEHRQKVREIAEFTARHFDEVILDDFFFTNCKCPACIEAKGERSWSDYRLALMTGAAQELVLEPARAVNPNVEVVIKYPNWYDHFQGCGFNLETQPPLFDRVYTGTETRDPVFGMQHIQPYEGYLIFRYFDAIKPGGNGGGWVDPFGSMLLDRYAEQLWLTLLAKAPEITLFDFRSVQQSIAARQRAPWQDGRSEQLPRLGIGFDFDAALAPVIAPDGTWPEETTIAAAAGYTFDQVDTILGELGTPVGVPSYKPFHSDGEDFLHNYLGMVGIPIDLRPDFPADAPTVLLTQHAAADPAIVDKIMANLRAGKNVVVTSGLFRALQGRGAPGHRIDDIVELEVTDQKASVKDFLIGWFQVYHAETGVLIPHVRYYTNDSWELISGMTQTTGHPMLQDADYGGGHLFLLTIPDNFDDLNQLPAGVLDRIRQVVAGDLYVRLTGPSQVMLFVYDNDTLIVESFLPEPVTVGLVIDAAAGGVRDVVTGEALAGRETHDWRNQPTGEAVVEVEIAPRAYRVFRLGA